MAKYVGNNFTGNILYHTKFHFKSLASKVTAEPESDEYKAAMLKKRQQRASRPFYALAMRIAAFDYALSRSFKPRRNALVRGFSGFFCAIGAGFLFGLGKVVASPFKLWRRIKYGKYNERIEADRVLMVSSEGPWDTYSKNLYRRFLNDKKLMKRVQHNLIFYSCLTENGGDSLFYLLEGDGPYASKEGNRARLFLDEVSQEKKLKNVKVLCFSDHSSPSQLAGFVAKEKALFKRLDKKNAWENNRWIDSKRGFAEASAEIEKLGGKFTYFFGSLKDRRRILRGRVSSDLKLALTDPDSDDYAVAIKR